MKRSIYNFVLYDDGWGYWYNALTGYFFRITERLSRKIFNLLSSGDQIKLLESYSIYDKLLTGGFVVYEDINELNIVREKHKEAVNTKNYFLVILPTLNCNYKCWYCIQDHIPSIMNDSVMQSVCKHIEHMVVNEDIKSLHIEWFGGEPFMFFNQIVKPVSEYAIGLCNEHGIPFMNSATTNGYFINKKTAGQLKKLDFLQFQITLDGERQFHDRVKFTKGCESTFDQVLHNINNILRYDYRTRVFLRINYTHNTLTKKIVEEVNNIIDKRYRERVTILPKKVWQESVDKDFSSVIVEILDLFEHFGYKVKRRDISLSYVPCYVNQKYYNAINYNGHAVKCTACDDLYSKEPKGRLMADGTIQWADRYDDKCTEATFENEMCLGCSRLPLCMGQCPRDIQLGHKRCKYSVSDGDFESELLDFLKNEYCRS